MTRKDVIQNQLSFYNTVINNLIFVGVLGILFFMIQSSNYEFNKSVSKIIFMMLVLGYAAYVLTNRRIKLLRELNDLP